MLQKQNRLTKRKEFGYIYKNGKKYYSKEMQLLTTTTKLGNARFGFVVSKKVGKAHTRNKIKRQLSEIVRTHLSEFNAQKNYIFVARPEIVTLSFADLTKAVLSLLDQSK